MKLRRRRTASRSRRISGLIRLLAVFVLTVFFAHTTVAWAFPCVCVDERGESGPEDDESKNCPCPLDCGPCCAGNALPAIPPTAASLVLPAAPSVERAGPLVERAPPLADCFEILRVPKPSRV